MGIETRLAGSPAQRFMSIDTPENKQFIEQWRAYVKAKNLPDGERRVTNDPMEATYLGVTMWAHAVQEAGSTDVDAVRAAMSHQVLRSPSGYDVSMDATDHHLHRPVYIGEITSNGQFQVVWRTNGPIRAQAWSPFLPK